MLPKSFIFPWRLAIGLLILTLAIAPLGLNYYVRLCLAKNSRFWVPIKVIPAIQSFAVVESYFCQYNVNSVTRQFLDPRSGLFV